MPADPHPLQSVGDLPTRGASVYLRSVGDLATELGDLPAADTAPTLQYEASPPPGYEIEKELGRGAFGVVYLARHKDDPDTPVALKVIAGRGKLDRLMLEPAMLAKLDHPNVVRVLDYFPHPDGGHLVMALEYVGGGDLKAAIDECGHFPPAVVREVLVQLGGALAEAHAKGVVHRDLKPANVLLDRTAAGTRYVLTDFGVGGEDGGIRQAKTVAGTYLFMAPEQLRGRPGPQSDLWALGVTAYRMLTGKYPFPGPSAEELARQIQLTTPPPPSEVVGEAIDHDLERAVLKLLDRSETERIASAGELLRELGATVSGPKSLVRSSGSGLRRLTHKARSLDQMLAGEYRRAVNWAAVWVTLFLMIGGVLAGGLSLAAALLFFRAHLRLAGWRKAAGILLALGLLGAAKGAHHYLLPVIESRLLEDVLFGLTAEQQREAERMVQATPGKVSPQFGILSMAVGVVALVLPALAGGSMARANRVRRDRLLLAAAGGTADEYVTRLRVELDRRTEDVGFHLRYAEALAARGDHRGAAVEARLLLEQDPYHFTGNLLLAQCYHRLGLHEDCRRVCDEYLAVAGYCFEFAELRDQCGKAGAA